MTKPKGDVPPTHGGCWFCWLKDDQLVFDTEWDTYVHLDCIRENLDDPYAGDEAQSMKYLLEESDGKEDEKEG